MKRAMERGIGMFVILMVSGCGTPETRWLSVRPRPVRDEVASYKWHDPFPDEEAGPKTFNRPRTFLEPRSDAQKSFDLRYIKAAYGFPQQRYAWDSSTSVSANQYPVQPLWRTQPAPMPIAVAPSW